MRQTLPLLLPLLIASCGSTSTLRFTGQDFTSDSGTLRIVGRKDIDRVVLTDSNLGFTIRLPYAEDWEFEPADRIPVAGRSASRRTVLTVQRHLPGKKVEDEFSYLQDEYLEIIKRIAPNQGLILQNEMIVKAGRLHFVLQYVTLTRMPQGPLRQIHFWAFRQRGGNEIIEAHVSTDVQEDPGPSKICGEIRSILGTEFQALPENKGR